MSGVTRRGWWLWLVGALGLGQEKSKPWPAPTGVGGRPKPDQVWDGTKWADLPKPKPKNGECPVCRTKHPVRKRQRGCIMVDGFGNLDNNAPCEPKAYQERCQWCSNSFWMDAEEGK